MATSNPQHPHPGKKRIIVCCDGTWMDSDGSFQQPSNVTRLARALKHYGVDAAGHPIPQVIFYQNGVGTGANSLYVTYVGGATGEGLAEHIREAYSFICLNYNAGDEIFLVGFSRGAFTARSVCSLIRVVGLLTPVGLEHFYPIFEDWQYQLKQNWKPSHPNNPWPGHGPPVEGPEYRRKLLELELTRPNIPVKAVAVWETVGGLGIPMIALLPQPPSIDFAFVDTKIDDNVEYAFQALALDEHRRTYTPTVWEKPAGQVLPTVLKQCWFPGVHSDVGGSYKNTDLANITLCWMISQLEPLLSFEHSYLWRQVRLSKERQEAKGQADLRFWGLGKIHDSMTMFFRLGGSLIRTPSEYTQTNPDLQHGTLSWMVRNIAHTIGRSLNLCQDTPLPRLQGTNEMMHSSVRVRMGKNGLGYNDKGHYDSQALRDWEFHSVVENPGDNKDNEHENPHHHHSLGKMKQVVWKKKIGIVVDDDGNETDQILEMPEDEMGPFELKILRLWPEVADGFETIRPGDHKQNVRRASTYPGDDHHSTDDGEDGLTTVASSKDGGDGKSFSRVVVVSVEGKDEGRQEQGNGQMRWPPLPHPPARMGTI